MAPVSVYRVGAVGADPSYLFGGQVPDSDLCHAVWLGWLPLTLISFAGLGVAIARDMWLTPSSGTSDPERAAAAGDVVTAQAAAGELLARGECGLTAFTTPPTDLQFDGSLWASSLAVLVADDLAAQIDRLRADHAALFDGTDGVEQERALLAARRCSPTSDSPVQRRFGRALRALQEGQLQLHRLLAAMVRIRVFDPALRGR